MNHRWGPAVTTRDNHQADADQLAHEKRVLAVRLMAPRAPRLGVLIAYWLLLLSGARPS